MARGVLVLGTRGSALALWQARHIKRRLERIGYIVDLQEISTAGDRIVDVPLSQINDKDLFTKELDLALLDGRIHLAVHSLKDLPTRLVDGIRLAAVAQRADPHDAFVAHRAVTESLADLPAGAIIATSSLRRRAQLKAWRQDLEIVSVRGNVDTRVNKLDQGDWHGLVLAAAGLRRLGMGNRITETVDTAIMLPAVGQGALGIVCAASDVEVYATLQDVIHDSASGYATAAERAMLRTLEGGCSVPVGAHGRIRDGVLIIEGSVTSVDGLRNCRHQVSGRPEDAERLGVMLAERLLSDGGDAILEELRKG